LNTGPFNIEIVPPSLEIEPPNHEIWLPNLDLKAGTTVVLQFALPILKSGLANLEI
jgi:hypothetical protein